MSEAAVWDGAAVTEMIRSGRFGDAAASISGVLDRAPGHLGASLARAHLAVARGDAPHAVELLERLGEQYPDNIWVTARLIDALLLAGETAAARERLLRALPPPSGHDRMVLGLAQRLAGDRTDVDGTLTFLAAMADAWPAQRAFAHAKRAGIALNASRVEEARDALKAAEASGPLPAFGTFTRDLLIMTDGDFAGAVRYLARRAGEEPDAVHVARHLNRALAASGAFAQARDHMVALAQSRPSDLGVAYRATHALLDPASDARVSAALKPHAESDMALPQFLFQYALIALRQGNVAEATGILERLSRDPASAAVASPMLAALIGARRAGIRSRVGHDVSVDVQTVRVPEARATLIVLGSLLGGVGRLPFAVMDPVLSDLPVNIVYLRDPYGLLFLRGVPGLGADLDETVRALGALIDELGAPRTVTVGTSLTGYAATRYALALGADAAVMFSGALRLREASPALRPTAVAMAQLRAAAGGEGDLLPAVAEAGEAFTLVVVAGEGHAADVAQGERTRGLANVERVLLPGVDHHFSAHAAIAAGTFTSILERVLMPRP